MQQDQVLTKFFWLSLLNEQQHAQHVHALSYADTQLSTGEGAQTLSTFKKQILYYCNEINY